MEPQFMMASAFKQQCLALVDQVARTKAPMIIIKRGRPVAKLVPLDEEVAHVRPTMGSVHLAAEEPAYYSTGEVWFAGALAAHGDVE